MFGPTTVVDAAARGRRRRWTFASTGLGVAAAVVTVAACSATAATGPADPGTSPASPPSAGTSPSSSAPGVTATIASSPNNGANGINPVSPIHVTVSDGTLTGLTMTNQSGERVSGAMADGDGSWHTTEVLGYAKTYTIHAKAVSTTGQPTTRTIVFHTLTPKSRVNASIDRMGLYGLSSGTYGVGIVPMVHFDQPVQNRAKVQSRLSVTTNRTVHGVWSWRDDEDVAYRPKNFWPAHTKVTVTAKVYGLDTGGGVYGASDESVSFTIGRRQITQAYDNAPQVDKVKVYDAHHRLLREMNTSMGKHGGETVDGKYFNFYTLDGTYTVLDHENPAIMSSQSYGLPATAENGYTKLKVPYSTKISVGGIYLHQFNSTIYQQNHGQDVSEGCLNLRTADAVWFYNHSIVGDPVVVHGAKGAPKLQPWDGGYWTEPWSTWTGDSATT